MPIGQLDPTVMIRLRQLIAQREAEQELRGLVEPPRTTRPSGLPDVPPPAMVRNLGIETNRPELIKALEQIQQVAPRAGVGVRTLTTVPTGDVLRYIAASGLDPSKFDEMNLVGETSQGGSRVYLNRGILNRRIPDAEPSTVLAHELTHSATGFQHAPTGETSIDPPDIAELLWNITKDPNFANRLLFRRPKKETP